jgi:hypothetical protein
MATVACRKQMNLYFISAYPISEKFARSFADLSCGLVNYLCPTSKLLELNRDDYLHCAPVEGDAPPRIYSVSAMLRNLEADRARVARLAAVEAKILDLERSLPGLRAKKTLAQERLNSFKYPVLTLPNEITSEVLIHFLIPALPAAHCQGLPDHSDTRFER